MMYLHSSFFCTTSSFSLCRKAVLTPFRLRDCFNNHVCKRSASQLRPPQQNVPIGGTNEKVFKEGKYYKPFVYRWMAFLDEKFGRWKFLKPFYDSPALERAMSSGLRLVYRDGTLSRASAARVIWIGYVSFALVVFAWIADLRDFGAECAARPIGCILLALAALTYGVHAQISCRSYVYAIHRIESKKPMIVPGLSKFSKSSQYVLTCANPLTGMEQKRLFTLDDVQSYDPPNSGSLLKRIMYGVFPVKPNYLIGNRPFMLEQHCICDEDFNGKLFSATMQRKETERRS